MPRRKVVIMGAAGRDFHDFNVAFRNDPSREVVAFTAAQIPNIAGRRYPRELAGPLYPDGIPIHPEDELEALIDRHHVDTVVFAYSDVSHEEVMHRASRALARGADFLLLGPRATMLRSSRPVVSVCAVRTGCGKSPASRKVAALLQAEGQRVAVVRHPMPYGDLARQACQRFATLDDLLRTECTIEEMEEYEPHLLAGSLVFAGVDYARILEAAEAEADVILWDGGNNDLPFYVPDLEIVLVDPHRAGHETRYFPGEANLLRADVIIINKVDSAPPGAVADLRRSVQARNPRATVVETAMPLAVEHPERIRGRRALVVEDGPTVTHGGMGFGAGILAAERSGAREFVHPRPIARGSILSALDQNPHLTRVLPALGYGETQLRELEATIAASGAEVVVLATPVDLRRVIHIGLPVCRVTYELQEPDGDVLGDVVRGVLRGVHA
jgi:predicted GTPase